MIISHNELVATVNKAFSGMHLHCGEADVIANMVADLQMVGLSGVKHFNAASQFLALDRDCAVTVKTLSQNTFEVDFHGDSVACHLPAVLDFALEKMVDCKTVSIKINQCYNRWFVYSELVYLASKGIACQAQWVNGTSPKRTLYVLNRGRIAPEIFFSDKLPSNHCDFHSMTITLSTQDFDVEQSAGDYSIHVDSVELANTLLTSWEEGIFVEDKEWEKLKHSATNFLVENSARSEQDAGELISLTN